MKMRSKINDRGFLTKGKIYETDSQGYFTYDNGKKSTFQYFDTSDIDACMPNCFEEVKEMTKDDIKAGYLVELQEKGLCLVIPINDRTQFYSQQSIVNLDLAESALENYTDNFTSANGFSEYDIIKIYGLSNKAKLFDTSTRPLLWQREEPTKEVTLADIEKLMGCKVKIVKEVTE